MEIKPTYVTFEQAKLLKEKRFNIPCFYYYENGKLIEPYFKNGSSTDTGFRVDLLDLLEHFNKHSKRVSAPEQWQVVEWLRVKHGIWIVIIPTITSDWTFKTVRVISEVDNDVILGLKSVSDLPPPQRCSWV